MSHHSNLHVCKCNKGEVEVRQGLLVIKLGRTDTPVQVLVPAKEPLSDIWGDTNLVTVITLKGKLIPSNNHHVSYLV